MVKISVKYGVICGLFLIVLFHISSFFSLNPLINIGHVIFDLIIFGVFIFFTLKEFKTYQNTGFLHFWQGMTMGFMVYMLASVVFGLALYFYFVIDGDAVINYQQEAINFLKERAEIYKEQFGDEVYLNQIKEIEGETLGRLTIRSTFKKMLVGFFITPVISIILRKQPK